MMNQLKTVLNLRQGTSLATALGAPGLPNGVSPFVNTTMEIARSGDVHRIVGAFSCGREDLIPGMFQKLVNVLAKNAPENWSRFLYYLNRHIESDGERHGPLAEKLLARVCGDDLALWSEAAEAARASLEVRLGLWHAISAEIASKKMTVPSVAGPMPGEASPPPALPRAGGCPDCPSLTERR